MAGCHVASTAKQTHWCCTLQHMTPQSHASTILTARYLAYSTPSSVKMPMWARSRPAHKAQDARLLSEEMWEGNKSTASPGNSRISNGCYAPMPLSSRLISSS